MNNLGAFYQLFQELLVYTANESSEKYNTRSHQISTLLWELEEL